MDAKTEVPGLYKTSDGYLINKDNDALLAYKMRKQQTKKMQDLEKDVSEIKSSIEDIKELLKGLVK